MASIELDKIVITGEGWILPERDGHFRQVSFFDTFFSQVIREPKELDFSTIPAKYRRRMSANDKQAVIAAQKCLADAGLDEWEDLAIVVATQWGEHQTVQKLLVDLAQQENPVLSPTLFHNSVHNAIAGYLGIILQARGPTLTVSQMEQSFEAALECACSLITTEQAQKVMVGISDTAFTFSLLDHPTKKNGSAFSGTGFLLMENFVSAQKRQANIIAFIRSLGSHRLTSQYKKYIANKIWQNGGKDWRQNYIAMVSGEKSDLAPKLLENIPQFSGEILSNSSGCGPENILPVLSKAKQTGRQILAMHIDNHARHRSFLITAY